MNSRAQAISSKTINKNKEIIEKQLRNAVIYPLKAITPKDAGAIYKAVTALFQKNQQLIAFIDLLHSACLGSEYLTADLRTYIINSVLSIPAVDTFIINLVDKLALNNMNWLEKENALPDIEIDRQFLESSLRDYFFQEYGKKIDKRAQIDSRPIRRMDSLARLFALNPIKSACSAVAFYNGELIIGANVSAPNELENVEGAIHERMKLISEFLRKISEENEIGNSYAAIKPHAEELCAQFVKHSCSSFQFGTIIQAISKVGHAVCFDKSEEIRGLFNQEVKENLFSDAIRYRILLPMFTSEGRVQILNLSSQIVNRDSIVYNKEIINLSGSRCRSISNIHAEQLIAYYIFKDQEIDHHNEENPLKIGISKLCCKSCYENLKELPVEVRGSHEQIYLDTANLIDQSKAPLTPPRTPRRAETATHASPNETPWKKNNAAVLFRSESTAKRRLEFYDESMDNDGLSPSLFPQ